MDVLPAEGYLEVELGEDHSAWPPEEKRVIHPLRFPASKLYSGTSLPMSDGWAAPRLARQLIPILSLTV